MGCDDSDTLIDHRAENDQDAASVCDAQLTDAKFAGTNFAGKIDGLVQNDLLGLRR